MTKQTTKKTPEFVTGAELLDFVQDVEQAATAACFLCGQPIASDAKVGFDLGRPAHWRCLLGQPDR